MTSSAEFENIMAEINPRVEVASSTSYEAIGEIGKVSFILDLELDPSVTLPPLAFTYQKNNNTIHVSCFFCSKKRHFTLQNYTNSTWSPVLFKNHEVRAMSCSTLCPSMLPQERELLFAYDITKYKSIYCDDNNQYLGAYHFANIPEHEIYLLNEDSFTLTCFFCRTTAVILLNDFFSSSWENLYFPTHEVVVVCSPSCIPAEFTY